MRKVTEQEIIQAFEKIISTNNELKCPSCGCEHIHIEDSIFIDLEETGHQKINTDEKYTYLTKIVLICEKCFYISYYSAAHLGIK